MVAESVFDRMTTIVDYRCLECLFILRGGMNARTREMSNYLFDIKLQPLPRDYFLGVGISPHVSKVKIVFTLNGLQL